MNTASATQRSIAMKKILVGILLVILVVGLGIAFAGCNTYNGLVSRKQEVDKQWAQVENVYQRRTDLIPNLVNTVSGAANFERSVLKEVTEARASVGQLKLPPGEAPASAEAFRQFEQAQGALSSALSRLLVVVEKYPDLKATAGFRDLQAQLEGTENRITVERQRFNEVVQSYNVTAQRFPGVIFARLFGFTPRPYFQATAGSDKPPKVEFNFGQPAPAKP
jgi:LemA protein